MDDRIIRGHVEAMKASQDLVLCACSWDDEDRPKERTVGHRNRVIARIASLFEKDDQLGEIGTLGTQFFVIRNRRDIVDLIMALKPVRGQSLEATFHQDFVATFSARNFLRMREREPVHPDKRYQCEEMSLFCQHWPARGTAEDRRPETHPLYASKTMIGKKEALERHGRLWHGPNIRKLLESSAYEYYNPGAKRY